MSDSSRIPPQASPIPSPKLQEFTQQQPSLLSIVKNAFNPVALLFGGSPKQLEGFEPISPMIPELREPDEPLIWQKTEGAFLDMISMDIPKEGVRLQEEPSQKAQSLHIPTLTTTSASLIAAIPEQDTRPSTEPEQLPQSLHIPALTTTPGSLIAAIPEQDTRPSTEPEQLQHSLRIPTQTTTPGSQIAAIPEQDTRSSTEPEQLQHSLRIPTQTTTPGSQIATTPEQEVSAPEKPAEPQQILDIPQSTTTQAAELANIGEEDPDANKTASTKPAATPLSQANTTLDVANRVATKVGAAATVTGTLAKGVDWLPGGAGVKQKAMGKIHALYQGIKFPSLSLGKVYQGTKALYQMASSIKSSELIGAAIVCGGLYWWFKRPRRTHQHYSRAETPVVINVNIPITANTNITAPTNVQIPAANLEPRVEK